jgi:hypothetical protein
MAMEWEKNALSEWFKGRHFVIRSGGSLNPSSSWEEFILGIDNSQVQQEAVFPIFGGGISWTPAVAFFV